MDLQAVDMRTCLVPPHLFFRMCITSNMLTLASLNRVSISTSRTGTEKCWFFSRRHSSSSGLLWGVPKQTSKRALQCFILRPLGRNFFIFLFGIKRFPNQNSWDYNIPFARNVHCKIPWSRDSCITRLDDRKIWLSQDSLITKFIHHKMWQSLDLKFARFDDSEIHQSW